MCTIRNKNGFTLIELMVVVAIFSVMLGSGFVLVSSSRDAWQITDAQIRLQDSLRQTLVKVSRELRETGSYHDDILNQDIPQFDIDDGVGVIGSDIVTFSMPVVCESGMNVMDADSNVAYWRAPLTWGCTQPACMDKDDDCATVDYKYVEYRLNASNQLVRRVLDGASVLIREDIFAENLTNFQVELNQAQTVIVLTASVSIQTNLNRQITAVNSLNVYLRNRIGGD